jgi:hypothetical protein
MVAVRVRVRVFVDVDVDVVVLPSPPVHAGALDNPCHIDMQGGLKRFG